MLSGCLQIHFIHIGRDFRIIAIANTPNLFAYLFCVYTDKNIHESACFSTYFDVGL